MCYGFLGFYGDLWDVEQSAGETEIHSQENEYKFHDVAGFVIRIDNQALRGRRKQKEKRFYEVEDLACHVEEYPCPKVGQRTADFIVCVVRVMTEILLRSHQAPSLPFLKLLRIFLNLHNFLPLILVKSIKHYETEEDAKGLEAEIPNFCITYGLP